MDGRTKEMRMTSWRTQHEDLFHGMGHELLLPSSRLDERDNIHNKRSCCRSSSMMMIMAPSSLVIACARRSSSSRLLTRLQHRPLLSRPCPLVASFLSTNTKPQNETDNTLVVPPNLTIDPRSTCSPFYGLQRMRETDKEEEEEEEKEEEEEREEGKAGEEGDHEMMDEEESNVIDEMDDDEEELVIYDRTTAPEPLRCIPLPDRLYATVFDKLDASKVGSLYLSPKIFGHDEIRVDLLQRTVEYQRNQKRGRRKARTKTISEVSGSGRKVRMQKGSGKARAGHSRPSHWRGGAKAHGPKGSIQDYSNCKLNKQVRKLALTHALSQKLKEHNLILVNDWNIETHKTKEMVKLLKQWEIGGTRRYGTCSAYLLDSVVTGKENNANLGLPINLTVACGNIPHVKVSNQLMANVYDILKYEKLVLTVSAVTALEARLEPLLRY